MVWKLSKISHTNFQFVFDKKFIAQDDHYFANQFKISFLHWFSHTVARESLSFFVHAISQHPFFLLEPVATAKWWDAALHQTYGRKSIVKELIFPSSEFLSFAGCLRKWRTLNAHFSRCYVYFLEVVQEYYTLGTLGFMAIVWVAISINIRHEQSMTTTPKRPWNAGYFGNRFTTFSWTSLTSTPHLWWFPNTVS